MFILPNIPKKLRPTVKAAVEFYEKELLSPQMRKYCYTLISQSKALTMSGIDGLSEVLEYNEQMKPREFLIRVRSFKKLKPLLITLAHEMVHVRQFAYNDMNEQMTRWRGSPVNIKKLKYKHYPWEKEAYKLEKELYKKFMETQK